MNDDVYPPYDLLTWLAVIAASVVATAGFVVARLHPGDVETLVIVLASALVASTSAVYLAWERACAAIGRPAMHAEAARTLRYVATLVGIMMVVVTSDYLVILRTHDRILEATVGLLLAVPSYFIVCRNWSRDRPAAPRKVGNLRSLMLIAPLSAIVFAIIENANAGTGALTRVNELVIALESTTVVMVVVGAIVLRQHTRSYEL